MMDIVNQIGHVQYWGLCPANNILKHHPNPKQPLKILISGCCDIRHILKTICDTMNTENAPSSLQIYVHQTNKELLCRCLLQLQILHETNLNFDERTEVFLDLYGNALIKQRNSNYLHRVREDLMNLIHEEKKTRTPLKYFVGTRLLKSAEIDEMSDLMKSWSSKIPFQMQKLRDQKLRYLYRQRYDYRQNLVDWDYNMLLTPCAPIVHYYHYKHWRMTGVAYQQRFSTYTEPNRTLASYAPGRRKDERTSCMVRGYWGDIVVSPYVALGAACDYPQAPLLFKKANLKYIGHSVQVAEYNMHYWLIMLEKGLEYEKVFKDYYRADQATKKQLEEKNQMKKKQKDLNTIKEQDEEQIQETVPESAKKTGKEDLDSDEEEQKRRIDQLNSKEVESSEEGAPVLLGLKKCGVKIELLGLPTQKLIAPKWEEAFDIVTLGFVHTAMVSKGVEAIVKKGGLLLTEKSTYLIPKKKEEREEINLRLQKLLQTSKRLQKVAEEGDLFVYRKVE